VKGEGNGGPRSATKKGSMTRKGEETISSTAAKNPKKNAGVQVEGGSSFLQGLGGGGWTYTGKEDKKRIRHREKENFIALPQSKRKEIELTLKERKSSRHRKEREGFRETSGELLSPYYSTKPRDFGGSFKKKGGTGKG